MKFQVLSDIHFEAFRCDPAVFFKNYLDISAKNIIIAGDLCAKKDFISTINMFADIYERVIFVPGNHDYYGYTIPYMNEFFKSLSNDRIHVLINDVVTIDDVRIAGTPLWFKKSHNPLVELEIRNTIRDFEYIKDFEKDVYIANARSIEFLKNVEADIIVTHFMPTSKSIHQKYAGDVCNEFFVCPVLDQYPIQTKHWIHGHTHEFFEYDYEGIRVTCNPFGYSGSNLGYLEDCTIDVGED